MRFHSDILTADKVAKIVRETDAPVYVNVLTDHRSRSRKNGIELKLFGSSSHYPNFGRNSYGDMAATWDEWGMVIGAMFAADPEMTCRAYDGADDFHYQTDSRFASDLPLQERHKRHKWVYAGGDFECKCGAGMRRSIR